MSYILYEDSSKLTVGDLKYYKLVLSDDAQKSYAEDWVAESLQAITACPAMLHIEESSEPLKLFAYIDERVKNTGANANIYRYNPELAGYVVDMEGNFICFVRDGKAH